MKKLLILLFSLLINNYASNADYSFAQDAKNGSVTQKAPESGLAGSKEKPQFIDMGNGVFAVYYGTAQPKDIIRVPKRTDPNPPNIFLLDTAVGLQFVSADSYFSTGTGVRTHENGVMVEDTFSGSGPLDTLAAYRNRVEVYPYTGRRFTFQANFTNFPPYNQINTNRVTIYYVMNMPYFQGVTGPQLRAFLAGRGEPAAIYNAGMLIFIEGGYASKWYITIWADYDINNSIVYQRGPPVIGVCGFRDSSTLPGGNFAYTVGGVGGPNNLISNSGNGNYVLGTVFAITGAMNSQLIPTAPGFIAWETYIGINQISTEIPSAYSLSQNYPNPFNSQTKIKFAVPRAGLVQMKVFDILGREVATLADKVMTAGIYEVSWNADGLTSGVYFYRMTAGEFTETKRMMLIR